MSYKEYCVHCGISMSAHTKEGREVFSDIHECPSMNRKQEYAAIWNGERYVVSSLWWYSVDGYEWTDSVGNNLDGEIFERATIALINGPMNGIKVS